MKPLLASYIASLRILRIVDFPAAEFPNKETPVFEVNALKSYITKKPIRSFASILSAKSSSNSLLAPNLACFYYTTPKTSFKIS